MRRASGASVLGIEAWPAAPLATIRHSFTHFDLDIEPWLVPLAAAQAPDRVAEPGCGFGPCHSLV